MQAIVLAVPITAQVPALEASLFSISPILDSETSPALNLDQYLLQSVQAPSLSFSNLLVIMGPAGITKNGLPAEIAPIIIAGKVLSHPPRRITTSTGCALIISSTSIDIKFRNIMLVGERLISPKEITGKSTAKHPSDSIPLFKATIISGK